MRTIRSIFRPINFLTVLCGAAVLAGIFFRFYKLGFPDKQVFDEVYFPVFANNYLHRQVFFDIHPPLGKLLISAGIAVFGNVPFGWRIIPCIFGVGTVGLMGLISWKIFKDKVATLIMVTFVALDGMFIIYSRTGLMDGILFFAIFACLFAATRLHKDSKNAVWCGITLGLAMAIKWPAIGILLPMFWYAWQAGKVRKLIESLPLALIMYVAIVYIGQVIIKAPNPWSEVIHWHSDVLKYNLSLTATHPWGSAWWTWPLPKRPVLFIYDVLPSGSINIETTLGNPVVWWLSSLAVVLSLGAVIQEVWKKRLNGLSHPLVPLLLGYFSLWLPWAVIHRVLFLYHYMPAYGFALLMLAYWLGKWWNKGFESSMMILLVVCVFFGLRYMPFAVGWIAVTPDTLKHLIIIQSWMY